MDLPEQLHFSRLQTTYFTIKVFYWSLPFVGTNDWEYITWPNVHDAPCGASLAVTCVELNDWLFFFLFLNVSIDLMPRWRQKHECLSAKSSFEWLNYSSKSRKTRMFRSSRLPIMSKSHENIFRCLIFHFNTVCTTKTTVHNVHCISSTSGFNSS